MLSGPTIDHQQPTKTSNFQVVWFQSMTLEENQAPIFLLSVVILLCLSLRFKSSSSSSSSPSPSPSSSSSSSSPSSLPSSSSPSSSAASSSVYTTCMLHHLSLVFDRSYTKLRKIRYNLFTMSRCPTTFSIQELAFFRNWFPNFGLPVVQVKNMICSTSHKAHRICCSVSWMESLRLFCGWGDPSRPFFSYVLLGHGILVMQDDVNGSQLRTWHVQEATVR